MAIGVVCLMTLSPWFGSRLPVVVPLTMRPCPSQGTGRKVPSIEAYCVIRQA